jgi:hypothetical protein
LKLGVIVATDARVTTTGAAGAFFAFGLFSLLLGSTGVELRLQRSECNALPGQFPELRLWITVGREPEIEVVLV